MIAVCDSYHLVVLSAIHVTYLTVPLAGVSYSLFCNLK